jgi:hypothetical protein
MSRLLESFPELPFQLLAIGTIANTLNDSISTPLWT